MMMDVDPHVLHTILEKIQQQLRCPQCGKKIVVDFTTIRVVAEGTMLLQLRCETCNTYIVLNASLQGVESLSAKPYPMDAKANASSNFQLNEEEMKLLRDGLASGSFEKMFAEQKKSE